MNRHPETVNTPRFQDQLRYTAAAMALFFSGVVPTGTTEARTSQPLVSQTFEADRPKTVEELVQAEADAHSRRMDPLGTRKDHFTARRQKITSQDGYPFITKRIKLPSKVFGRISN